MVVVPVDTFVEDDSTTDGPLKILGVIVATMDAVVVVGVIGVIFVVIVVVVVVDDFGVPFKRLANSLAALLLASLSGVDVVACLVDEIGDVVVAVDIRRCIELAAAAANRAAKALPPSAVGEAVIVNGASLVSLRRGGLISW